MGGEKVLAACSSLVAFRSHSSKQGCLDSGSHLLGSTIRLVSRIAGWIAFAAALVHTKLGFGGISSLTKAFIRSVAGH